jgi:hypothetical protein
MEGKAILFKTFGGLDAVPIALATTDVDQIVETVARIAPSFGAINLEDVSSPRCFEIERRLQDALDIPVFHDDQPPESPPRRFCWPQGSATSCSVTAGERFTAGAPI